MDSEYLILVRHGHEFLPVKKVAELFYSSATTVRRNLEAIEKEPRYKNAWIYLNSDGDKIINILVYTDYLYYKSRLKQKNLSKLLPAFDEAEVRKRRGEYQTIKDEV